MPAMQHSQGGRGITLWSHKTGPNGWKVAIVLSELGLRYNTVFVDFAKGDHRTEEFLHICPNGRIPAIVDHDNDDFAVWESGAILLYLAQMYDKHERLWSSDPKIQSQITSWIFFQVSGHSVMQGQAVYFSFFSRDRTPSAISRYINETRRVYGVLEMRLAEQRELMASAKESIDTSPISNIEDDEGDSNEKSVWLVDQRCTLADLSFLTWAKVVDRLGIELEAEYPEVNKWIGGMLERPEVQHALIGSSLDEANQ